MEGVWPSKNSCSVISSTLPCRARVIRPGLCRESFSSGEGLGVEGCGWCVPRGEAGRRRKGGRRLKLRERRTKVDTRTVREACSAVAGKR